MGERHQTIGIKQAIRLEWMEKVSNLVLAGLDAKAVRLELHEFLSDKKGTGSQGKRSDETRTFVVNNLMRIWVSPDPDLIPFRDASLGHLRENPSAAMAVHWGMVSAVYPFWCSVAMQTGRLLSLQHHVTQMQITNRLKELYGDRQMVSRIVRFIIRSFVAWGALKDLDTKGCYEKAPPINIADYNLAILMLEATLLATPEATGSLGLLLHNPALFPFALPVITGDLVSQRSSRIDVLRYGLNEDLLKLRVC